MGHALDCDVIQAALQAAKLKQGGTAQANKFYAFLASYALSLLMVEF